MALNVREAAVVMAAASQPKIDAGDWAEERGIGLTLFYGWNDLARQCFFWSQKPSPDTARGAAEHIHQRLIEVEASEEAIRDWNARTS